MTYTEYVEKCISQKPIAEPIFTTEISKKMEECFQIPRAKAAAATSVAWSPSEWGHDTKGTSSH